MHRTRLGFAIVLLAVAACAPDPAPGEPLQPQPAEPAPIRIADRIAGRSGGAGADRIDQKLRKDLQPSLLDVLQAPDAIEIFALYPHPVDADEDPELYRLPWFQAHPILGEGKLASADERHEIVALVCEGLFLTGASARCFNPRHGLRITSGETTVDLLICYECGNGLAYGLPGKVQSLYTSAAVEPLVSAFFEERGLRIHRDE